MQKIIAAENSGKRLDKFLKEEFFDISRGEIIRQIKDGKVTVDGGVVKPSYVLTEGDKIVVNFDFEGDILAPNSKLSIDILFEDEDIVVISKPFGVQMHPSATERKNTVANWAIAKYPSIREVHDSSKGSHLRPGIVHRLDKDTSGVIVLAKSKRAFDELKRLFSEKKVIKKYEALLFGNLVKTEGSIEKPIARATNFKKQKIAEGKIKGKSREAITDYRVLKSYEGFDLVEALPRTGRMHQIRVHFFSIGHPVVGDKKYFLAKNDNMIAKKAKRQLLHAKELKFEIFGKKYDFFCEISSDFAFFLAGLTKKG